mmetsp:Transcript_6157/g.13534  ORF Transcript_6157/g.13534 Transcript_6157/m.13534 type:complete len:151 (+) Transcript_6157:223-675(+)
MASFAAATAAGVRFGRVVLMARGAEGVANSVNFYQNALGLTVVRHTDDWAELACGIGGRDDQPSSSSSSIPQQASGAFRLTIRSVESEAQLSAGYAPILTFDVDDMDMTVARCAQMGASLDGPIQYPAHGKVAALRAPDGYIIGLYEPAI